MWNIIKSEIFYAKSKLVVGIIILLLFSGFALLNIQLLEGTNFIGKYFWAILVGLGTYILIYSIWFIKIKDKARNFFYVFGFYFADFCLFFQFFILLSII